MGTLARVLATLILLAIPARATAQAAVPLKVIVFPGGFNWPIWAAQQQGLFAREGLEVQLTPTPSSVFQLTNLIEGKFDIGMTAIDNVIAYQEGQGEAPVQGTPDLFAFMGGDNGFLRLIVQADIRAYADLKGRELSVDALTTGYAFVLRKMLEHGGLKEGDYTLVRAGGVLQRWEALKERKHAGTLLITPFEIIAESLGFRRLGNAVDVLGRYQGLVGAARRSWAQGHATELGGFIRAYRAGLTWLYDRSHRDPALQLLQKNVPGMSHDLAAKTYDVLLAPAGGFEPAARLDVEGIRTVLKLRSEYGRPKKDLTDPSRYYDLSHYERAAGPR
ncbi:MAG TPA: ABC transporter substrate-binding protein [Methylomirabilota bacterium]|jgi:ABC-type nitrate/sulfonate/bicarbonate transport system substrate-binding protein|nr:ABC transporter substrate-binding protein [Methylomirabilota bacterium]HEV8673811.1 ABC transporter substrate-binding protein [Methylomirabilota bacterium]